MANTYTLIASQTVGSGGASAINFGSIPNTYTDLLVKVSARMSSANGSAGITFNGTNTNYSFRYLYGSGSSAASGSGGSSYIDSGVYDWSAATANTFANAEFYVPNYASNNAKSVSLDTVAENNATEAYAWMEAGFWNNSAAITSLSIVPQGGGTNFVQYSTAYLYGINNS